MVEKKMKVQKPKLKSKTVKKVQTAIAKPKAESSAVKKKSGLAVDVYNAAGKIVDSIILPKDVFGVKVNKTLMAQAVRVYLANQRAGSASTKTRGEVQGSTRKIYRQKGTGRARHGGIRAPIFVHGGIAHGPKPRDFSLKLSQKMKKAALISALSAKYEESAIKIVADVEKMEPKTRNMSLLLTKMGRKAKNEKTLFVMDTKHDNVIRAVRNILGLKYDYVKLLNTYEVLMSDSLILTKEAVAEIEKNFASKNV